MADRTYSGWRGWFLGIGYMLVTLLVIGAIRIFIGVALGLCIGLHSHADDVVADFMNFLSAMATGWWACKICEAP